MTFSLIPIYIPASSVTVPDTMYLLPKGFKTMFARQYQAHVVDREDFRCFEKGMKDMFHERSLSNSFLPASVVAKIYSHIGQYYTA
jgi:hypothetical protein